MSLSLTTTHPLLPTTSYDCVGSAGQRCETHGKPIRKSGKCRTGAAHMKKAEPCVLCGTMVPEHLGYVPNPQINGTFEGVATLFARVIAQTNPDLLLALVNLPEGLDDNTRICDGCRESMEVCWGTGEFDDGKEVLTVTDNNDQPVTLMMETVEAKTLGAKQAQESVSKAQRLVKAFIEGQKIGKHRVEKVGDVFMNWCTCGCGTSGTAQEMRGIVNGRFAACFCQKCLDQVEDLEFETFSFADALKIARGVKTADQCRNNEAPEPEPEREAEAPEPEPEPERNGFSTILELAQAILAGERVNFGRKTDDGRTICVVHANAPELCDCPDGKGNWKAMGAIVKGQSAYGFGTSCTSKLIEQGMMVSITLQEALAGILGFEIRPDREHNPRPRQNQGNIRRPGQSQQRGPQYPNPTAKPSGNKRSRAAARAQAARQERNAKAQAAFDAKIGLLVEQVLARQFRLDEIPGKISSLGGSMAHMDEEDKQAARELISELKTERSHLQGELEILEAEHAKVEKAGPKAFRR
ncbi:hypothetical protein HN358_04250 [Candidatus Uhrbacteria bacterium]|jgi:hypothetical protein|nr:hypothetical protein [Candidatus Uhrbacteria bacterium]MBT7716995.1 hypothetical protein [Candidatus Uhrbacteria bacterium]